MVAKIRLELKEYHFARSLTILVLVCGVVCSALVSSFCRSFPDASLWEFVVFTLDNQYIVLVLFPILLLAFTSSRRREVCRYPLLVRYRSRNEFFAVKLISRILFVPLAMLSLVGAIVLTGYLRGLSGGFAQACFTVVPLNRILPAMLLNIFCYFCFILILHEILRTVLRGGMVDLFLSAGLPIVNLVFVKLQITKIVLWTPWGNIAYTLSGWERADYQFYWWYWLLLLITSLYIAEIFHKRKDYVFEENRKTD